VWPSEPVFDSAASAHPAAGQDGTCTHPSTGHCSACTSTYHHAAVCHATGSGMTPHNRTMMHHGGCKQRKTGKGPAWAADGPGSPHSCGQASTCSRVESADYGSFTGDSGSEKGGATVQSGDDAEPGTPQVVVKNTFLHVEGCGYTDKRAFLQVRFGRPLPPPLEFIPCEVATDELLAFRIDYQMFRAGEAFGAKGELSDCPTTHFERGGPATRLGRPGGEETSPRQHGS